MTKLLFALACATISGTLAIPSFIAQQRENECRFATEQPTSLSAGTYVFQQFYQHPPSLQFNFVIKSEGECLDPPLVFLKDQIVASTALDADTIRFSGEIQTSEMELILSIPSTNTCVFELQQSYLSHELPLNQICPVGMSWAIDFQPLTQNEDDETELMQDFLEIMDQEIPKSVAGLSLIDGIRDFVHYDYKTKWKGLSKDKRDICRAAYEQIRQVSVKIEPFITGDLSQQKVAETTAKIACAYLNSFIPDPIQHVNFKTIPLSGFNKKWRKFATNQLPTFPKMVMQSKDSRLHQCLVSNTSPGYIASGTYVFRNLLLEMQSLHFDFQIKATGSSCLQHHPSVLLRTDFIMSVNTGTTTTEGEMIRIVGDIESENEMLLSIPSPKFCVYQLVQASLALQLPTSERLDQYCQIGQQLDIDWGKSVAVDLLSTDEAWGDFVLELDEIPKSVAGILAVDGIWNYVTLNYEATWKGLSKDERKSCRNAYKTMRYVFNRIERFITGDMSQRSNIERAVGAACEHLNTLITNPKHKVDSQTVSLSVFFNRWNKYGIEDRAIIQVDPSKLPTTQEDLGLIDAIHNYVIYNYKTQFEALPADEKKPFGNAYWRIRKSYLRIQPYQTGDLSERKEIEATIQAAVISLLPNAQVNYKTITVGSFEYRTKLLVSRKRRRSSQEE